MIDIDAYLESKRELVNRSLFQFLPVGAPSVLTAAMRYNLEAGGKRLRPVLTLATTEAIGAGNESVINIACAVEMVHTYSLIHDDLPAMDDSDLRRGVPTCHKVYGEAVAVLTGDAFLTLAFDIIARYGLIEGNADKAVKISAKLAEAAGTKGMIGGQVFDLLAEGKDLALDDVEKIASLKTGALLKAAVTCGAIAAGASKNQLKLLEEFAGSIGTAFQIIDDLLDYEGTCEEIGKPVGSDQARLKATYPALLGIEKARAKTEKLYHDALEALEKLDCPTELLAALAHKLVYRAN
ncbi:MAG: polyprenyl synthetase family protein [Bacillota bacterium]|nr:polyprenyl synthetase family protein [Bacillota bacterium]